MNVRELCRLLSATLHLPGVERYAARLVRRGLLPRAGCEVGSIDAALLLMTTAGFKPVQGLSGVSGRVLATPLFRPSERRRKPGLF